MEGKTHSNETKECTETRDSYHNEFQRIPLHVMSVPAKMVRCIKSLYKSTYKKNAFKKHHRYPIVEIENNIIWILDENGNGFSFNNQSGYLFDNYFVKIED